MKNPLKVNTRYPTKLEIQYLNKTVGCNTTHHFEQFGVYKLNQSTCQISTLTRFYYFGYTTFFISNVCFVRPVNAFLPIFWAFVLLCLLIGLRLAYQSVYKTAIFRRFLVWIQLRSGNRLLSDTEEEQVSHDNE